MHALSKSWVATLLMGGLTLSFVVWGIADVFTGASTTGVASVGGTEISAQDFQRGYRNMQRTQSQQMGMEITPEMATKMGLPQAALQQMISGTAANNEAASLGLTVSDTQVAQYVRAMAPFRGALGTFDRPTFMQAINNAGYTEEQFLNEVRQELIRDQLTQSLESNFLVPATYAQALFQYINEKRAVDYIVRGKMIGGFALVAWPAQYGNSGVMTFIVNHDGIVYQKDLGAATAKQAAAMTRFDPAPGWKPVLTD